MKNIYPSLMGADQSNLQQVIGLLDDHVPGYHLDIMDNKFVPNKTWDASEVNAITNLTRRTLWAHLMVERPADWVDTLQLPGGSIVSFHFEATGQNGKLIERIKNKNWKVGIAVNPKTSIEKIFPVLNLVDQVLIMSVEPGFAGQPFIPDVMDKLPALVGYRQTAGLNFRIAMDGGVSLDNIAQLAGKGVDDFAVASAVFNYPDPVEALKFLQKKLA